MDLTTEDKLFSSSATENLTTCNKDGEITKYFEEKAGTLMKEQEDSCPLRGKSTQVSIPPQIVPLKAMRRHMSILTVRKCNSLFSLIWKPLRPILNNFSKYTTTVSHQLLGPVTLDVRFGFFFGSMICRKIEECLPSVVQDLYFSGYIFKVGIQTSNHAQCLFL